MISTQDREVSSSLRDAITSGDLPLSTSLANKLVSKLPDDVSSSLLVDAVLSFDGSATDMVKLCLEHEKIGASAKSSRDGTPAIHVAAGLFDDTDSPFSSSPDDGNNDPSLSKRGTSASLIELLFRAGCPLDIGDLLGNKPLHVAAAAGDVEAVSALIKFGANVFATGHLGFTALHDAVGSACNGGVRFSASTMNIDAAPAGDAGELVATSAAGNGGNSRKIDVVRLLIRSGAIIDAQGDNGVTALHIACLDGDVECARVLVNEGKATVWPIIRDEGWTALHAAAQGGSPDCTTTILEASLLDASLRRKPSESVSGSGGGSWKPGASKRAGKTDTTTCDVDLLCARGTDGSTALHIAAARGFRDVATVLLGHHANPHDKDIRGRDSLFAAALAGASDCVSLLAPLCDVTQRENGSLRTPIHVTCALGLPQCLPPLLSRLNEQQEQKEQKEQKDHWTSTLVDSKGLTPLHYAAGGLLTDEKGELCAPIVVLPGGDTADCKAARVGIVTHGHVECVQRLTAGAGSLAASKTLVNAAGSSGADCLGRSALHIASVTPTAANMAASLIDLGASTSKGDDRGDTALHLATRHMNTEVLAALFDSGVVDIAAKNAAGESVLHIAAADATRRSIAAVLVRSGADLVARDNGNRTPADVARLHGNDTFLAMLAEVREGGKAKAKKKAGKKKDAGKKNLASPRGSGLLPTTSPQSSPLASSSAQSSPKGRDAGKESSSVASSALELHAAAHAGDSAGVIRIIRGGTHVDAITPDGTGATALHVAAYQGHENVVATLSDRGAAINARDATDRTPLHCACQAGTVDCVRLLMRLGADRSLVDSSGRSALHFAVSFPETDCAKLLLPERPDGDNADPVVCLADASGETPLHYAANHGSADCAQLLLDYLAPVDPKNIDHWTPLHKASRKNFTGCAAVLIDGGANLNAATVDKLRPLHLAAMSGKVGCAALLLDKGCNVDPYCSSFRTPLCDACENDDVKLATLFVNKGASVSGVANLPGAEEGPLHICAKSGSIQCATLLIRRRCDIDLRTGTGQLTALHIAASRGDAAFVQLLVDAGTSVSLEDSAGRTPLDVAVANAHLDVVQVLRNANAESGKKKSSTSGGSSKLSQPTEGAGGGASGAADRDVAAQNNAAGYAGGAGGRSGQKTAGKGTVAKARRSGLRPQSARRVPVAQFLDAVSYGDIREITHLLAKGASVNESVDPETGLTGLHLASERGFVDVVTLLLDKGADVSARDARGRTALHVSADAGHATVTNVLLSRGASLLCKDDDGCTALHYAAVRSGAGASLAEEIVARGADVDAKDNSGKTPLHYSARAGAISCAKVLVRGNADVDSTDNRGWSALHETCDAMAEKSHTTLKGGDGTGEAAQGRPGSAKPRGSTGAGGDGGSSGVGPDGGGAKDAGATAAVSASVAFDPFLGVVETLIDAGADVNVRAVDGVTPLHLAAHAGSVDLAEALIDSGASVSAPTSSGWTPLHQAAESGSVDLVRLLVKHGAPLNAVDDNGETPISLAEAAGHLDCAKFIYSVGSINGPEEPTIAGLLAAVARNAVTETCRILDSASSSGGSSVGPNDGDAAGWRAIHVAAKHGFIPCARALVDRAADVNVKEISGRTPLHIAAEAARSDMCKFLLAHGADSTIGDDAGCTALHYAAMAPSTTTTDVLIADSSNSGKNSATNPLDAKDSHLATPLHYAARAGAEENVKSIIAKGADPSAVDDRGWSALHEAASRNNLSCALVLIDHGANVNQKSTDGATPLHLAAFCSEADCAVLLIEQGAVVNARGTNGYTPLHEAASMGDLKLVSLLLQRNGDPSCLTDFDETALHLAARNGHTKIVSALIKHRARVRIADTRGWTALHEAAAGGHIDCITLLIRKNAEINAVTKDGFTAADLAEAAGHNAAAAVLAEKGGRSGVSGGGSFRQQQRYASSQQQQQQQQQQRQGTQNSQHQSGSGRGRGKGRGVVPVPHTGNKTQYKPAVAGLPPAMAAMRGSSVVRRSGAVGTRQRAALQVAAAANNSGARRKPASGSVVGSKKAVKGLVIGPGASVPKRSGPAVPQKSGKGKGVGRRPVAPPKPTKRP